MANKHSVEGARTSKQFKRAVTKQGGWVETGGKHPTPHTHATSPQARGTPSSSSSSPLALWCFLSFVP